MFIELTNDADVKVTFNIDDISYFHAKVSGAVKSTVWLRGASAGIPVKEAYDEINTLLNNHIFITVTEVQPEDKSINPKSRVETTAIINKNDISAVLSRTDGTVIRLNTDREIKVTQTYNSVVDEVKKK